MSGEVEGRREVASLEVVGGCRFVPFLAAVQVGAVGHAGKERVGGIRGRDADLRTVRTVMVRGQGGTPLVRQHTVVTQVVLQVPQVFEHGGRASGWRHGDSVVACAGLKHLKLLIMNLIMRHLCKGVYYLLYFIFCPVEVFYEIENLKRISILLSLP